MREGDIDKLNIQKEQQVKPEKTQEQINLEKDIERDQIEQQLEQEDIKAMGHKDMEGRKLNKEIKVKEAHRDLFKEAQMQEGISTSLGETKADREKCGECLEQEEVPTKIGKVFDQATRETEDV